MLERLEIRLKARYFFIPVLIGAIALSACGSAIEEPTQVPAATSEPVEEAGITPPTEVKPTEAEDVDEEPLEESVPSGAFELTSPGFLHETPIPTKYSCDGEDVSPPLVWGDPPEGTRSFALINDDPDAPVGIWVHWVLYNIPAESRGLVEAIPAQEALEDGSLHGENSWGRRDYGGPCPPGGTHRYFFKLYALDTMLDLDAGADKQALLDAMVGHILAEAELMGTYSR